MLSGLQKANPRNPGQEMSFKQMTQSYTFQLPVRCEELNHTDSRVGEWSLIGGYVLS